MSLHLQLASRIRRHAAVVRARGAIGPHTRLLRRRRIAGAARRSRADHRPRARHDVHMKMGDALADDVVVGDERAAGIERDRASRRRSTAHVSKNGPTSSRLEIGERHHMRPGTTSVCPRNSGERSRNATATSSRHTSWAGDTPSDDIAEHASPARHPARRSLHGRPAHPPRPMTGAVQLSTLLGLALRPPGSPGRPQDVRGDRDRSPLERRRAQRDRARQASARSRARTRMVVDTSVLIADPHCLTIVRRGGAGDTAHRGRGARQPQDPPRRRRTRGAHRAPGDRGPARASTAGRSPSRSGRRRHVQIEINGIQKHLLVEHGLDPAVPDNRIIGAALGQAGIGPTVMLSNDAALAHQGRPSRRRRRRAPADQARRGPSARSGGA